MRFPWSSAVPARPSVVRAHVLVLATLGLVSCGGDDPVGVDDDEPQPASVPTAEITSPPDGAVLNQGTTDDETISIQGEACDATNPITSVVLRGASLPLSGGGACRSFSAALNSTWGLNVLDALVSNDLTNEVAVVQSYLRSPAYFAPPPPRAGSARAPGDVVGIPNAWRARLGQEAIDDGDRGDVDDLVSLMNVALDALLPTLTSGINSEMPNPFYNTVGSTSYDCIFPISDKTNRQGVRFQPGTVNVGDWELLEVDVAPDVIVLDFEVSSLSIALSGGAYLDLGCVGETSASVSGVVGTAGIRIAAAFIIEQVGDKTEFTLGPIAVLIGTIGVDLDLTGIALIDSLLSSAVSGVANAFRAILVPIFDLVVVPLLMSDLEPFLRLDAFDLPEIDDDFLGVTLEVEASTDLVEAGDDFLELGVVVNVYPSAYTKSDSELASGSILGSSTLPAFDGMTGSLGMGIKHDLINRVFWALWAGGAFDREGPADAVLALMNGAISEPGVSLTSMEMSLPPVLMPGEIQSEVKVGIGGIAITADLQQSSPSLFVGQPVVTVTTPVTIHASVFLTATIGFDPVARSVGFEFSNEAEVNVQIVNALRTPAMIALEAGLEEAVETGVGALIDGAGAYLALPELEVGALGVPGIPPGLKWVLDDGVLDQAAGYLRILGSVGIVN